ncbi:sulfatase family protein [Aestuariibaculum lutulentum]|uniref:Sulfatase n=1 Tax=Aestuariibaculum lutulentum TaxID=2920935 RepID=A0ABS9RHR6_9FLAO|nr:sulfatase [Aestuariibaculum lutulentum]MCH4552496.1 sulfatase [Aestuariibaculum lutulentum]
MKRLFYCLVVFSFFSCNTSTSKIEKSEASKPNVVLFYLDDSGYGDVAHNGNPTIKTPNITKLKESGVSFTQFYVTAAACSASRYSLLTGRYPGRSGLGWWVIAPGTKQYIHTNELTLAEGLKSVGYKTGMFGKWHLGTPNEKNNFTPDALPLAHGFDEWIGTNVSHDYNNAMLLQSDSEGTNPAKGYKVLAKDLPSDTLTSESLTGVCTKAAVNFIKKNKSNPFFAYIPYNMPHLGLFVSDKFKGTSRNGELGDVMEELDAAIGDVCNALEEAGIRDNTIIIFSSDNGPWIKWSTRSDSEKYGDTRLKVGYATPFRDGKGSTWEGGHRVPGIISWPAKIKGDRNEQIPISTLDILPTILSITGAELPKDRTIDGRDISDLLLNESTTSQFENFEFFYSYDDNYPSAIRKDAWKLHTRIGSQTGDDYGYVASKESPLLFQVEKDLGERVDVANENPELVSELLTEFELFEKQLKEEGSFWDNQ